MSKPRKHAELIKAWADGAEIQARSKGEVGWGWRDLETPTWKDDYEYRIKPNTLKYRLALYEQQNGSPDKSFVYVFYETMPDPTRAGGFVRWLTDWTEIEL